MSSWFNTTSTLRHVSAIPEGIPASKLVEDPAPTIPAARGVTATGEPDCYRVTDKVHTLPAGLWDSDIVSTYEMIDVRDGVFVRIRSPMSVMMESLWLVKETEQGRLELVEEQVITASRLLMSTVKSMSEAGWEGIHASMIKKAQE
ncbi:uncharacterized protein BBA_01196 [Beauveria bassiana ARSEF 2860]|uniref:DUF7053 domain-containing protein n=1 Tax=Beauveria bassiana (strain ARSEF 2860) TaxID=655819 RepID=J4UVV4_BEAB2|nr:uncharacterized protein BBA_01196 [Beauveria bassiana ARSEF 2860]EJP70327.1 hypothetical protein BBA_01196 [Beauveria bassiana ARSEF 2860]